MTGSNFQGTAPGVGRGGVSAREKPLCAIIQMLVLGGLCFLRRPWFLVPQFQLSAVPTSAAPTLGSLLDEVYFRVQDKRCSFNSQQKFNRWDDSLLILYSLN